MSRWILYKSLAVLLVLVGWGVYTYYPYFPSNYYSRSANQRVIAATRVSRGQQKKRNVVVISLDGLRSDVLHQLGQEKLPNFFRLMREGSSTLNARTAARYTYTLPNHICMVTGRGVDGALGHNYILNRMPHKTLHQNKGAYLSSVFDVLHDHGYTTALVASKPKFVLFSWSYDAKNGRTDHIAPNHGTNKIDHVAIFRQDERAIQAFLKLWQTSRPHFTFLHLRGPDKAGHHYSWMSRHYLNAVQQMDRYLGQVLQALQPSKVQPSTTLIVTTDHGGTGHHHSQFRLLQNYRIPMFTWGAGVKAGADLYKLNATLYRNPGSKRLSYHEPHQPIRNCNVANLVTSLFDLPPVPGSTIGAKHPLRLR